MINEKLLETVADIAYIFGNNSYFSGDSRADIQDIIYYAIEFEKQKHNWSKEDYISLIENYSNKIINELHSLNQ